MRDLTQLPIFKNAESILDDLKQYRDIPEMQEAARQLVTTLNTTMDMSSTIFFHADLPKYALIALQNEEINETQFVSMLLIWAAFKDYPKEKQFTCKAYQVTDEDEDTKQKLKEYLVIQHTQVTDLFGCASLTINDDMVEESKEKLFASLLTKDVLSSERCFYIFTVKDPGESFEIFRGIKNIGFDLFMPKYNKNNETYEFIIPSLTIIQSALNVLVKDSKTLVPRIGEDSFASVYKMHEQNAHPFGVSFPGKYEKEKADDFKSGCFGFALHDIYHVTLLSFTPQAHKEVFNALIAIGRKLRTSVEMNKKKSYSEAVGSLIDNEFRQYVAGSTAGQMRGEKQKKLINSNEIAVLIGMLNILAKSVSYTNALNDYYLKDDKKKSEQSEISLIQELQQINPKHTVANKLQFCKELIAQIFQVNGVLNQQRIQLNELVDILFTEDIVIKIFALDKAGFDYSGVIEANKISIGLIQQQVLRYVQDPKNQKESSWLKNYFDIAQRFEKAVLKNDIEQMKEMLSDKEYLKYYVNIDRIHGIKPSLLKQAVQSGYTEIVQLLHSAGASLNDPLLIDVVKNNDPNMLQCLLEEGADPLQLDERGLSVVDYCLELGYVECLKAVLGYTSLGRDHFVYLEYKGITIHSDCKPLLERYNRFKEALYDVKDSNNNNRRSLLEKLVKSNDDGFSYLTQTECSRYQIIEKFPRYPELKKYPNTYMYRNILNKLEIEDIYYLNKHNKLHINQIDGGGNSALINLIDGDSENEMMKYQLLKELGANVKYVSAKGNSALSKAFEKNKFHLVEHLVKDGAEFDFEAIDNNYLNSVLSYLNQNPNGSESFDRAFSLMLEKGFNLNMKHQLSISNGWFNFNPQIKIVTPWSLMRDKGLLNISIRLRIFCIEKGADPDELSYNGKLELNVAIINGRDDYLELLLKNKANPNKTASDGQSPLHVAARAGNEKMMALLKGYGAKSTPDRCGNTPEDILKKIQSKTKVSSMSLFKPSIAEPSQQNAAPTVSLDC